MTWEPNSRFMQHRYRCEWCDHPVAPEEVKCEACARAELDKQLEEEGRGFSESED